ncbi:MAG: DUF2062 domain-containing protein [Planctomycetota bacterium]
MKTDHIRDALGSLLTIRDSPHALALGASLGLFVGLTPTVGIQMAAVVVLGTFIGANRIVAVAMVWISNPLTMVPMYYGYYYAGTFILGSQRWTFGNFSQKAEALARLGWIDALVSLGAEVGVPLLVGSLVMATLTALLAYPITLGLVLACQSRRLEPTAPALVWTAPASAVDRAAGSALPRQGPVSALEPRASPVAAREESPS